MWIIPDYIDVTYNLRYTKAFSPQINKYVRVINVYDNLLDWAFREYDIIVHKQQDVPAYIRLNNTWYALSELLINEDSVYFKSELILFKNIEPPAHSKYLAKVPIITQNDWDLLIKKGGV